jgi:hypothetical protein
MPNSPKKHLSERDLLKIELPELRYQVDMKLFDHGQDLSAELLKLSLAGIAVVGVLLPLLPKSVSFPGAGDGTFKLLFSSSVIAFAISTSTALFQHFFASSAMFHHVKAMKIAFHDDPSLDETIDREIDTRLKKFTLAHSLLKATAILLATGAALLGGAFIRLMFIL